MLDDPRVQALHPTLVTNSRAEEMSSESSFAPCVWVLNFFQSHSISPQPQASPHNTTIHAPLRCAGGSEKMIRISGTARQPTCSAWSLNELVHRRSIVLGLALNTLSQSTYLSALNSYLTFCALPRGLFTAWGGPFLGYAFPSI